MCSGPAGKTLVDVMLFAAQFSFCMCYMLIFANNIDLVVCEETQHDYCGNQQSYVMLAALVILPVCWLRTYGCIAYISAVAGVFVFISLFIIMGYGEQELRAHPEYHDHIKYVGLGQFPMFFGTAVFAFEGNGVAISLRANMQEPEHFMTIALHVIATYTILLVVFSTFCYEAFGSTTQDMIILNLPHDNLATTIQILYAFAMLGTYPMQVLPALALLENTEFFSSLPSFCC